MSPSLIKSRFYCRLEIFSTSLAFTPGGEMFIELRPTLSPALFGGAELKLKNTSLASFRSSERRVESWVWPIDKQLTPTVIDKFHVAAYGLNQCIATRLLFLPNSSRLRAIAIALTQGDTRGCNKASRRVQRFLKHLGSPS
jgi:hypothetical protein